MATPAQEKWDRLLEETWNGLPGGLSGVARMKEAHRLTRKNYGKRPSGVQATILKALWGWKRHGGADMNWDWTKTLWKAIRGALGAGLAMLVLFMLESFNEAGELERAGVPGWMIPIAVMVVGFIISWYRNKIAVAAPEKNLVKKVGAKIQPALQAIGKKKVGV